MPLFQNCTTPPKLADLITHGVNLRPVAHDRSMLYVVGHGGREAIEVFDVAANHDKPVVTWKGCVPMPDGFVANSVASLADGSLVATVPLMPGSTFADSFAGRYVRDGRSMVAGQYRRSRDRSRH